MSGCTVPLAVDVDRDNSNSQNRLERMKSYLRARLPSMVEDGSAAGEQEAHEKLAHIWDDLFGVVREIAHNLATELPHKTEDTDPELSHVSVL